MSKKVLFKNYSGGNDLFPHVTFHPLPHLIQSGHVGKDNVAIRENPMLSRRDFLLGSAAAVGGGCLVGALRNSLVVVQAGARNEEGTVAVVQFSDSGQKIGPVRVKRVVKTDAEWKQQL